MAGYQDQAFAIGSTDSATPIGHIGSEVTNAMELRQLRYFVTLAEELHFGRAAAREHIVQSALSQHIQRLERELGVQLVERNTHHVKLTRAGEAMLTEAHAVLDAVKRAIVVAQEASVDTEILRVSVLDASLDSMPQVLRSVQYNHPNLVVDRMEVPVPAQYRMLAEGGLDVGFGNAAHAPPGIASELLRLDVLGVLLSEDHPLATGDAVHLDALEGVPLVLADDARDPEFNEYFSLLCEGAGFRPTRHHGTVQSIRAAAYLVIQQHCAAIAPRSCDLLMPRMCWLPLTPQARYPWSLLWREGNETWPVQAVRTSMRALQHKLGWTPAQLTPLARDNGGSQAPVVTAHEPSSTVARSA